MAPLSLTWTGDFSIRLVFFQRNVAVLDGIIKTQGSAQPALVGEE
jgi:hypothetical protein